MLTERIVRDATANGKAYTIWDTQIKGLGLQVTQAGKKNYIVRYRADGRKRQAILCRVAEVSLRAVRERAGAELFRIRNGETDPLERRRQALEAPTVSELVERFFAEVAPARMAVGRMTAKTVENYQSQARVYIVPLLGSHKVAKVRRADVEHFAAKIKSPTQRNRVLQFTSRLFSDAERWEWRPPHSNPVRLVERAREDPRDRVLALSEMTALAGALDALETAHPFPVNAIRIAALTGMRISETLAMAWGHIDFETGRVVLPTTKTGRRVAPLPTPVLDLLERLPRINGNPWVFAAARGAHTTYKMARRVFATACEGAGLVDVRLHDLRRSLATRLAGAGINAYVLRDVLGHSTLTMSNRYVQMAGEALTDAVEKGAAVTVAAMAGKQAEVIPMERRHG